MAPLRIDLQAALRRQELFTLYQPVVSLTDGTLTSAEALARWPHRTLGLVAPARFVPLAEQAGLIGALSRHVLRDAVAQADWWNRHTPGDPLVVSVNVPARSLAGPGRIDALEQIVVGNDARTDQVMLELTGCGAVANEDELRRTITALRNRGFRMALDDVMGAFVAASRRDAVDAIKIDRRLIEGLGRAEGTEQTVAGIVERAHDAGVTVVAKGVDGPRQRDAVAALGCDEVQGFGIAAPGTGRQVAELRWQEMERRLRPVPA